MLKTMSTSRKKSFLGPWGWASFQRMLHRREDCAIVPTGAYSRSLICGYSCSENAAFRASSRERKRVCYAPEIIEQIAAGEMSAVQCGDN